MEGERLEFRGGKYTSFIPFLLFLGSCMVESVLGYASLEAFWISAAIGVVLCIVLAEEPQECFQFIIKGTATDMITVVIFCWIFSGIFAGILGASDLVSGLIWAGMKTGMKGGFFVPVAFIITCLYSTSTGTGSGSIMTMGAVLYPAGVALGANPLVIAGAIISGGCFGDNLAPVSDTTIVAAATMEVDMPGVMKTRIPYTAVAGFISFAVHTCLGFAISGDSATSTASKINDMFALSPKGLLMLIPALLVVILALKGVNLVLSLSTGSILAIILGIPTGVLDMRDVLCFKDGSVSGSIVESLSNFTGLILLLLLTYTLAIILIESGAMEDIMTFLKEKIHNVRQAEVINCLIIALSALALCSNVTSQIVAGPFMKEIADEFNLSHYRSANFSDAIQAMFSYTMPWGGPSILFCTTTALIAKTYSWCPVINDPLKVVFLTVHPFVLGAVYLFIAATGIGRKRDEKIEQERALSSFYLF